MYALQVQTMCIIDLPVEFSVVLFLMELVPPKKDGRVHQGQVCLCFVGGTNERFE